MRRAEEEQREPAGRLVSRERQAEGATAGSRGAGTSWPVETLSGGAEIEGGEGCTPAGGAAGGGHDGRLARQRVDFN